MNTTATKQHATMAFAVWVRGTGADQLAKTGSAAWEPSDDKSMPLAFDLNEVTGPVAVTPPDPWAKARKIRGRDHLSFTIDVTGPDAAITCPTNPATDRYWYDLAGEMIRAAYRLDGILRVTVINRHNQWHPRPVEVSVPLACPTCGAERGWPRGYNFVEDGESFHSHTWDNECGHIDMYEALLAEAAAFAGGTVGWPPRVDDVWRDTALGVTWNTRLDAEGWPEFYEPNGPGHVPAGDLEKFTTDGRVGGGLVLVRRGGKPFAGRDDG